jgi:L-fuconolactonase
MIIDAHHHLWDPQTRRHAWLDPLPALRRPFTLEEFTGLAAARGVTGSVLVQVLPSAAETAEFLALAAAGTGAETADGAGTGARAETGAGAETLVAGVVGWADLTAPDVADQVARLRALPGGDRLAGIRHLVQDEPDPDWLDRPDVRRGLRALGEAGLVYDLLVRPAQLPAAIRTARDLPGVRFVLDHGGKPDIAHGRLEPWASLVAELAAQPNVACKLSGLVTEAGPGYSAARIGPYAGRLIEAFEPDRLMFGSDWPVCTLAASYGGVLDLAVALLAGRLGSAGMDAVLGGNAVRIYGLCAPGRSPAPSSPGGSQH